MRQNIAGNSPWEGPYGYSRAVRVGSVVHVSGTTATDASGEIVGVDDAGAQTRQIYTNIAAALERAGATLRDVVRIRTYVVRLDDCRAVLEVQGEVFGDIRPAATLVQVSALVDPRMLVEIEADAVVG